MGNDALGPSSAIFWVQSLVELGNGLLVLGFEDDFAKGPLQIGVSDFGVFSSDFLAAGFAFTLDHATVRGIALHGF